jgi:glycosidase
VATANTTMEFHVSRKARDLYQLDDSLFSLRGNVIFLNLFAARIFAQKMNQKRDLVTFPEQAVRVGQLAAMGLIDEILHHVLSLYREQVSAGVMEEAIEWLHESVREEEVEKTLLAFVREFPPTDVYRRKVPAEVFLNGLVDGHPARTVVLEEMLMLWLANRNPAFSPFVELFDDTDLKRETAYLRIMGRLQDFFSRQPPFGPYTQSIVEMLRTPSVVVPHSLPGQLEYIREHWGFLLDKYIFRLLGSLDIFKEETKPPFLGPGPSEIYRFAGLEVEAEHFTPDREWMPRLVLMAKNIYVWLHQLSVKYSRPISGLTEIPDEELDLLARSGFSGLWLIGIWERSPASQKIKQLRGNPEAVPSAYSLFDYEIAFDLGGEDAFQNLKGRAWKRGIRIASDMVPNHTGIYSKWVTERPDWFISLKENPFPWYSFNGPELSPDDRVSLRVEDHYYDATDAAVVFKRTDLSTGDATHIYHGNDGTSMPWNDTAQLNYLNPQVREAMIDTIVKVARKFPVIRFDAAMTLTKRHYQRLWFPEPGGGGAIATRAEHGLSKEEFNRLMPNEFWREVVDRIASEAPDTLLLAEAFWLLEGYFVRTLGMHRVYNSAFMNMLRDEENAKYRTVMKNTLEFDPEVLRRFVNFMNNPDERTAVDQFGTDDKYFGICTMMVTMPGLPMFGHGQVEGLSEKYGMEYKRAYLDEYPDTHLIQRHEREIFPLLRRRELFAGIDNFLLYDFFTPEGKVDENVFAYSNSLGTERTLVMYHNSNAHIRGWIRTSTSFSLKTSGDGSRTLVQRSIGEGLKLSKGTGLYVIFRDHLTGLEYIRKSDILAEQGLYVELSPYGYHVFLDFRETADNEWRHYEQLTNYLGDRGVPSLEEALRLIFIQPIQTSFARLFSGNRVNTLAEVLTLVSSAATGGIEQDFLEKVSDDAYALFREVKGYIGGEGDDRLLAEATAREMARFLEMANHEMLYGYAVSEKVKEVLSRLTPFACANTTRCGIMVSWLIVHSLGGMVLTGKEADWQSRAWIDEWRLSRIMTQTFKDLGLDEDNAGRAIDTVKLLTLHQGWFETARHDGATHLAETLFGDSEVHQFLQVNRYKEVLWFNKESFEELLSWLLFTEIIRLVSDPVAALEEKREEIRLCCGVVARLQEGSDKSDYQVARLLEMVREQSPATSSPPLAAPSAPHI